ncbi:hypothetical protein MPSEU_000536200 [Mayamaea pseudoterrestris]|nr:hypothetical protein MPSEU_000536200 [Mayamaea pseudoterrestris]
MILSSKMFTLLASRSAAKLSRTPSLLSTASRTYQSRAHPRPIPEVPLIDAMNDLLTLCEQKNRRRQRKLKRNQASIASPPPEDVASESTDVAASPKLDETVELAVNLNLDPRKPGQALRGSVELPHGTGKSLACAVFTKDEGLMAMAKQRGALYAGDDGLVEDIVEGKVPVDSFQRALATSDMLPVLSQRAARLLGPRGLMPNAKSNTLFSTKDELLESLESQLAGKEVQYRTDKEGIVHVPVGKASFGMEKLLENTGQVMKELLNVKPESYGKGKKSGKSTGKSAKYFLKASLSSTQGKGVRLDMRTVDPSSPFFLTSVEDSVSAEKAA